MVLKDYITPLFRYWWLLLAAAVVAMVSSFLVTLQQPPIYQTRTTLIVGRAVFEANPSSNDLWLSQQLAAYYADIGMRGEVQAGTMQALGLNWLPEYYVRPLQNSQLLEISVTDTSPLRAQAVANELANQLMQRSPTASQQGQQHQAFINEQITYLEGKIKDTLLEIDRAEKQLTEMKSARQIADTQNEIAALQDKLAQLQANYASLISNTGQGAINTLSMIERAPLPAAPIGPRKSLTILVSAALAVVIAAGASYLLAYLDDTLKTPEEITQWLNLTVIGRIPAIQDGTNKVVSAPRGVGAVISGALAGMVGKKNTPEPEDTPAHMEAVGAYAAKNPRSAVAEEFRLLRINLDFAGIDHELKTILVTSASPGEGKTSVATNLAIVMAQGGKKVILIDADFRKPRIHEHFKMYNNRGLSDVFRDNLEVEDVMQRWRDESLFVVTTGLTPPNPVDLLSSNRMVQLLDDLKDQSSVIIIDGPPLIMPEALALSTKVDGVLLVARHSYTRKATVQTGLKQMRQVNARVLGLVLNRIPRAGMHQNGGYTYYAYYGDHPAEGEGAPEAEKIAPVR